MGQVNQGEVLPQGLYACSFVKTLTLGIQLIGVVWMHWYVSVTYGLTWSEFGLGEKESTEIVQRLNVSFLKKCAVCADPSDVRIGHKKRKGTEQTGRQKSRKDSAKLREVTSVRLLTFLKLTLSLCTISVPSFSRLVRTQNENLQGRVIHATQNGNFHKLFPFANCIV